MFIIKVKLVRPDIFFTLITFHEAGLSLRSMLNIDS